MVKLALCNSIISISSYKHSFQKWWKEDWKRNWLKIIFIVMLLFCLITWLHFSFHILILPITTSLFPLSKSLSSGYCMNTLVYKNVCFFYLAQRHLIKKETRELPCFKMYQNNYDYKSGCKINKQKSPMEKQTRQYTIKTLQKLWLNIKLNLPLD